MISPGKKQRPRPVWAYAYQLLPPQREDRLQIIRALLEEENAAAQRGARTWAGRMVLEEQITHIMVVSDSPEQNREVNRKLEAALKALDAEYSLTAALAVEGGDTDLPPATLTPGEES